MNLREEYINFFKKNGHKQIPRAPIVPKNDPTVLFNTAGMQPLVPYLLGNHILMERGFVIIKSVLRLTDLEEIGDKTHHTFL